MSTYLEDKINRTKRDLLFRRYKCQAFFRKSDGEILGVGWCLDPPNANKFQLYGVEELFDGAQAAENYLRELEKQRLSSEEKEEN
jgi:hypothetical protein